MRYGSICSGIEAASVAWHPLGWTPAFFAEIDRFPSAVLAHHYPDVPNAGDFTGIKGDEYGAIDLLVGGTPCQSFSVAGLRGGLADDRGNLALEFLRLADRTRPRWLVWENVPGVLSSSGGRDFGAILGGLVELRYGFAYRVLDAQFFGVPQRRRRVFVVGYLGDWRRAAAVLFERHSLQGNPPPSRKTREGIAPTISARPTGGGGLGTDFDCDGGLIAHALRGEGFDASEDGTGRGTPIITAESYVPDFVHQAMSSKWSKGSSGPAGDEIANLVAYRTNAAGQVYSQGDRAAAVTTQTDPCSQFIAFNVTPSNSNKDYNAREAAHAQALTGGGNRPSARGGDMVGFDLRNGTADGVTMALQSGGMGDERGLCPNAIPHTLSSGVRRLTPRECERLQGFPEIENTVKIFVCKSEEEKRARALSAESLFPASGQGASVPVAVHAQIDLERQHLQLHSLGKSPLFASIAEFANLSRPRMPAAGFAHLAALMHATVERTTRDGVAALPRSTQHSSHHMNGSVSALLSGCEIDELASDAERFTSVLTHCLKSTTLEVGHDSRSFDSAWQTLVCCAAVAINGFIPEEMRNACSYELSVTTHCGYTAISHRGKPAADGPRYKALGNSMAVPVMRWIGERIARVEAIREAA